MKTKILTILCIVLTKLSFGQYQQYEQYLTPFLSAPIESGFFYFTTPNNIQAGQLYNWYKINAPDPDNSMWLIDEHIDSLVHFKHFKYQQAYKNIPVEGAGCIEHYDTNGSLSFINAKIADSINKDPNPKISHKEAISSLIKILKKEDEKIQFAWESEDWEKQIKLDHNNELATWYPTVELIWAIDTMKNVQLVIPGSRYNLAYKISITTLNPSYETIVYFLNANTGSILKSQSTSMNDGPANIQGYGSRIIDTRWKGGFTQKYILETNDATRVIHTKKNPNGSSAWWVLDNTTDNDDNWGYSYDTETTTHYFVSKAWDYFRNTFGRTGQNNASREIRVRTQWNQNNADFVPEGGSNNTLRFGYTSSGGHYGAEPSVVAHEFTHGVTYHSSNLNYSHESGALNESFSDIFGIVIQAVMLDGGNTDWIYGNFVANPIQKQRSLKSPKLFGEHLDVNNTLNVGQPDTYNQQYWYSGTLDNGGVHINSGVQNKWFYILAHGENGSNDLNNYYQINGIGMSKAARIAYLALTSILINSSQYSDSRQATITAAKDLYGECSIEHQATIDSWYAVGIGNLNSCTYTLSIDNLTNLNVSVYPNPTNHVLNFELPIVTLEPIQFFDVTGKLIKEFTNNSVYFQTDISNFEDGIYLIRMNLKGQQITKRIIIKK